MSLQMTKLDTRPLLVIAMVMVFMIVAGCGNKLPGVYRLDIQQGNVITQEMLDQLELGMDRRKVRFILGTPLVTDPFNQNRWDYLYSFQEGGGDRVQRHVSLLFESDLLIRIEGDIRSGPTPEGTRPRQETIVTVPAERRKKGFLSSLIPGFMKKAPVKRSVPATAAESSGSAATVANTTGPEAGAIEAKGEPETISAEERADLEKLFGEYGKLDSEVDEPAPRSPLPTSRDFESR